MLPLPLLAVFGALTLPLPLPLPVADPTEGVRRRVDDGPACVVLSCRDASVTDEVPTGGRRSGFWAVADLSGHFVVPLAIAGPALGWVDTDAGAALDEAD